MLAIFLKTVPFFALIGLGYCAARIRFFLHPDHTQRRLWDLWLLVLIVYVAIAIPLRIGFVRASLRALPTRRG